jgi:hypothetical protein
VYAHAQNDYALRPFGANARGYGRDHVNELLNQPLPQAETLHGGGEP